MVDQYIIDCDSHITEPSDVWSSRTPKKYLDYVPQVVRNDEGVDIWVLGGQQIATVGGHTPAGWKTFPHDYPKTYEDCHAGSYNATARLDYMDKVGIWAQVLFPNVAGFGMQRFLNIKNEEAKRLAVRAYNDFLREWTSADRRRLLPIGAIPYWDIDATVREIAYCKGLDLRGILFTGEPQRFGLPIIGDHHWDPLWSAAVEVGLPIHFHIGGGDTRNDHEERLRVHGHAAAAAYEAVNLFLKNGIQCCDLITSGVLERYPTLKFVSVESGIGWLPFMLEAADYSWLGITEIGRKRTSRLLPSELFARQVYCTFWFEQVAPNRLLDDVPVDNILFETDFPHTACLYDDNVGETVDRGLANVSRDIRSKILWENASKLYGVALPQVLV